MTKTPLKILILFVWLLALAGCGSFKNAVYIQDAELTDSLYTKNKPEYQVQPYDVLYIRILSDNTEVNELLNPMGGSGSNAVQAGALYISGYVVNEEGFIELPLIQGVEVAGMTIDQIEQKVRAKARQYIKEPFVSVKMANFRYSVLGEVNAPGFIEAPTAQMNILEAMARAGDITYYGNRREVLIMRQYPEGTQTFAIDLTDRNILGSPQMYLQPNDIVYVQPVKMAPFRARASDYLLILGAVTSTITAVALVITLL